jgi:fumarate reductase subunit C
MIRTYRRPVSGWWWQRSAFYRWYMLRELSCVFITLYALVLLFGLYRLTQGADAFDAWKDALGSPLAMIFHAVALVLVVYHSWTWFKVMPKTMPFVPVPDRGIVALGVAAAVVSSVLLWLLIR